MLFLGKSRIKFRSKVGKSLVNEISEESKIVLNHLKKINTPELNLSYEIPYSR